MDAESLIAELVTAVAAKDVTAITMTAVALGRLLERLGAETLTSFDDEVLLLPDATRRARRIDPPAEHKPGRAVAQTRPGPNYPHDVGVA